MANILVVGGSKFIGKHILGLLNDGNHSITVINRGNVPSEKYLPKDAEHFVVDREKDEDLHKALDGKSFDVVIDVCAITAEHVQKLLAVIEGNIKRHVHVSSGSVYNEKALSLPIIEDHPFPVIKEDTHPYIKAKTEAEIELFKAYNERGFPMTIVRPTFVYGPDNYIYREAYFFDRITRERAILLPEKGEGYFDMVHVEDLARLTVQLAFEEDNKVIGEAFNASRERLLSANMYTEQVEKNLGKKSEKVYYTQDLLKELEWPQEKFIYPYVATGVFNMSTRKVEEVLGFKHEYNYDNGLESAFAWWKKQDNKEPDWELEDALIAYIKAKDDKKTSDEDKAKIKSALVDLIAITKEEIEKSKKD